MSGLAVVWLLVGVNPDQAERETRKALGALRKEGFTANTAGPEAVLAKAAEINQHVTQQRKAVVER